MEDIVKNEHLKMASALIANQTNIELHVWDIGEDERIHIKTRPKTDSDYIHFNTSHMTSCAMDFNILFKVYGYCPYRCRSCFKLIIRPPNMDVMKGVRNLAVKHVMSGKWGCDLRDDTIGVEKIYIYNKSYEDAMANAKVLYDEGVPKGMMEIQPGCSEIMQKFGDLSKLPLSQEEYDEQRRIEDRFFIEPSPKTPEWVEDAIHAKLVTIARMMNDETWVNHTQVDLAPPVPSYRVDFEED